MHFSILGGPVVHRVHVLRRLWLLFLYGVVSIACRFLISRRAAKISSSNDALRRLWRLVWNRIYFVSFYVKTHVRKKLRCSAAKGYEHVFWKVGLFFRKIGDQYVKRQFLYDLHYTGRIHCDCRLSDILIRLYQHDPVFSSIYEDRCPRHWR